MRIVLAFRLFFAALFKATTAKKLSDSLAAIDDKTVATYPPIDSKSPQPTASSSAPSKTSSASQRSDAITLLATLQNEARLLDLVQEPLDGYSDADIGKAARDVLRDTSKVLMRLFELESLCKEEEGTTIELPQPIDAARWRLIGSSAKPKFGNLVHAGWKAKQASIPIWTGSKNDALVIAPAEVEVR